MLNRLKKNKLIAVKVLAALLVVAVVLTLIPFRDVMAWSNAGQSGYWNFHYNVSTGSNDTQFWVTVEFSAYGNNASMSGKFKGSLSGSSGATNSPQATSAASKSGKGEHSLGSKTIYYNKSTSAYTSTTTATLENTETGSKVTKKFTYTVGALQSYAVYCDPNGGSGGGTVSGYYGSTVYLPGTPSRTGYTFTGWSGYGAGQAFLAQNLPAGPLYAGWTPNNYPIDVNATLEGVAQGSLGSFGTFDIAVGGVTYGNDVNDYYASHPYTSSYSVTDIKAKPGYKYVGNSYYSGNIYGNTTVVLPFQRLRVYYNANGGTEASPHASGMMINAANGMIMNNGSQWATVVNTSYNLENPQNTSGINLKRTRYHLEEGQEWNTRADGQGVTYNKNTAYNMNTFGGDTTLYANWKANNYTIQYLPNAEDVAGVMPAQKIVATGTNYAISNSFRRDGFKLRGWDRDPNKDPTESLDIVGDKGTIPATMLDAYENGETIQLYAIWRPIEDSQTDIYAGKIMRDLPDSVANQDSFTFRIQPVEAMLTDNESTYESGQYMAADDMPMPEDTPAGQRYKDIQVTGIAGNVGILRSQSFGLIEFNDPGWYMYKVTEIAGQNARITYDKSSYFVVAYVQYKEDTGYKIEVTNTTAWHNRNGLSNYRPNLDDISMITDNKGDAAKSNDDGVYGKTGIGRQSVVTTFWNTEYQTDIPSGTTDDLFITKNVKGNLGDRTKNFNYEGVFTGLAPNAAYAVENEGAVLGDGFTGNAMIADANGSARITFTMSDDQSLFIGELPKNSTFEITESRNNHSPGYKVFTGAGTVKEGRSLIRTSISTGSIELTETDEMYTVLFENFRDKAVNTGVLERGLPLAGILAVLLAVTVFAARRKRKKPRIEED